MMSLQVFHLFAFGINESHPVWKLTQAETSGREYLIAALPVF